MSRRDEHDDHLGLDFHLRVIRDGELSRRDLVRWAMGAGLVAMLGCGDDDTSGVGGQGGAAAVGGRSAGTNAGAGHSGGDSSADAGACTQTPEETEGPYPADGSNGASAGGPGGMRGAPSTGGSASTDVINALTIAGITRSDIRSSVGTSTTMAEGVPVTLNLRIVTADGCNPIQGAAVYVWHCDRSGNYSLYASALMNENYLRGVQVADADGKVTFKTIFPACYSGRWPHIHYEVYPTAKNATLYTNKLATSQIAMPEEACNDVFASDGYDPSVANLRMVTLQSDMVFSDSSQSELPQISGNVADGYTIDFTAMIDTDR